MTECIGMTWVELQAAAITVNMQDRHPKTQEELDAALKKMIEERIWVKTCSVHPDMYISPRDRYKRRDASLRGQA